MFDRRAWIVLVGGLALSLAVNLFLIGVLGGRTSRAGALSRGDAQLAMLVRYQALPDAERGRFRAVMLRHAGALRATGRALGEAQQRTLAAMRQQPYDKARMLGAFAEQRDAMQARQAAMQDALADALGSLSGGARAMLAGGTMTQP